MPESSPVSPKTCVKHGKRSRRSSRATLSVEELTPDDMGYDADIETLQPNEYEDADSEVEANLNEMVHPGSKSLMWPDVDGELAGQMRQLSWRQTKPTSRLKSKHNRDLKSGDGHSLPTHLNQYGKRPELDIAEVMEGQETLPPTKRRRKRSARSSPTKQNMRGNLGLLGYPSDQTESYRTSVLMETTESTVVSEAGNGAQDEAMEVD